MTTLKLPRIANGAAEFASMIGFTFTANLFLALIGPFGTMFTMDLAGRVAHWLLSGLGIASINLAGLWAARRFYGAKPMPLWLVAFVAAAASAPGALIVHACLRLWSPEALPHVHLINLFAQCVLINVTLTTLSFALFGNRENAEAKTSASGPDTAKAFMQRLPAPFRTATLYAVAAEDHYLKVMTDRGDTLIHMRIGDAEALLATVDGLRVHRSHWVARKAIASVLRKRGQMALLLTNGASAPVSRSRLEALAKAGWPEF